MAKKNTKRNIEYTKRNIADEIMGLDIAYLFGKIPKKKYDKTRKALKLDFMKQKR